MKLNRRVCFRAAAVAVGLMPLVIAEVALQYVGWPEQPPSDLYSEAATSRPLFVESSVHNRWEIASNRLEYFRPDSFSRDKPADRRRVFVLGGSTVQGRPYETETAFSTWLRLSLEAAHPGNTWEVVNCGGVS